MSANALIDRKYYSLYVGNLSADIRRKELCQYLEQFGPVEQCQLIEANYRRRTYFAFVLMSTPDSINRLMASRPHFLDNRRLHLKRESLEQCSNKVEHFLTTENVLIQFKKNQNNEINEPDFNEENVRHYFQTYGKIVNLSLLKNHRCVIEFNDYDSVDCILLDSPHYFNFHELQIDKYFSTDQLKHLERVLTQHQELSDSNDDEQDEYSSHSRRCLNMRLRLMKDSILSSQVSNEIKLETMHRGFLSTIDRRKELLEQIEQLNKQCQVLHEKNQNLREMNDERVQSTVQLETTFQEQIDDEEKKQKEWERKNRSLDGQS